MLHLNLQMFADEGAAASGSNGYAAGTNGQASTADNATAGQAAAVSFDDVLKNPDYKAEYDARMKKALNGRYKEMQALQDRQNKVNPMLEMIGRKYGVTASEDGSWDIDALSKAMMDDDSYYEEEALEMGLTVSQLKEMRKLQRDNESLRAQFEAKQQEEENRAFFSQLAEQGDALKQLYPSFDIQAEMDNPQFARLIMNGVPVKGAFEAVHMDEILGGAMQYTAQRVAQNVSNAYRANAGRPNESGRGNGNAAIHDFDPTAMTAEQRKALREKVYRGERVEF